MIRKIISGGQTGADLGGLVGAAFRGIPTGGWMPKGFRREDGNHPEMKEIYGMQEHPSYNYQRRTYQNAKDSDGTVWFGNIGSAGYWCTLRGCDQYKKPFRVVTTSQELLAFIEEFKIEILNVAGNRESTNPSLQQRVIDIILAAFKDGTEV